MDSSNSSNAIGNMPIIKVSPAAIPAATKPPAITPAALTPGVWVECTFVGMPRQPYVVLRNFGGQSQVWLTTAETPSVTTTRSYRALSKSKMVFLGKTRRRWFWKILPWRNRVCPFRPVARVL